MGAVVAVVPLHIEEFNAVAGLIFSQLYRSFPNNVDIDRAGIARAMGIEDANWHDYQLPSGKKLGELIAYTIAWLNSQNYIFSSGAHPASRVVLTDKGLSAMNAIPSGLKQALGTELAEAEGRAPTVGYGAVGELIGGIFGGYVKSAGGG